MPREAQIINLKQLSEAQLWNLRMMRWKARTDLGWLCRNILGFEHVTDNSLFPCPLEDGPDDPIHQPIIDVLQKFPIPTQKQFVDNDQVVSGQWSYTPITPLTKLSGARRVLILDPRGFLKTTINVVAHTIQWIINYPDIAMLVVQSTGGKATDFLQKIKKHFQGNDRFRRLFPEHCPTRGINDWGRQDRFTTEARSPGNMRSEPTAQATSIDSGAAGIHVDVMKFSDIVDPSNITGNGLVTVIDSFYMMQNLLVGPSYWIDVEGTRYAYGDLYGKIIENELELRKKGKTQYRIHARPVFKQIMPPGEKAQYIPEQLEYPFEHDENGKRIPLWPRRFGLEYLETMEREQPEIFATQQLNNPGAAAKGGRPFPIENGEYEAHVISRQNFRENVRVAYKEISVDCAWTVGMRSDYTSIVVGTFDHFGRCYVEEIVHGRMQPDEVNKQIVLLIIKHFKQLKCVKIENTAFTHGMLPGLRRLLDLKSIFVEFKIIPRENDKSKEDRILKTLQPWYKSRDLRFLSDLDEKAVDHLKRELQQFPSGEHDDILDSISDLFQDKEWFGRETPNPVTNEERQHYANQLVREAMDASWKRMIGETDAYDRENVGNYHAGLGAL